MPKPEAIRSALNWKNDISQCPHFNERLTLDTISTLESQEEEELLAKSRPEFYGRAARIIEMCLDRTFSQLGQRGKLGLIDSTGMPISSEEITDFETLGYKMNASLITDVHSVINTMRSYKEDMHDFDEFLDFELINHNRALLRGIGINDPRFPFYAGISTATSHISKLLQQFSDFCEQEGYEHSQKVQIIEKSHKPLMRLSSISIDQLVIFQDNYITKLNQNDLLKVRKNGNNESIDFRIDILQLEPKEGVTLGSKETSSKPHIGCPVLFGRNQVRDLWRWGTAIADSSNLF